MPLFDSSSFQGSRVLGLAFRTVLTQPVAQRLSVLCVLVVSFLIGYLPSGSWVAGLAIASLWIFLPWVDDSDRDPNITHAR